MDKTKCFKCGYESENNKRKFQTHLCEICFRYSPNEIEEFKEYVNEKIPSETLETYRKYFKPGETQKQGMSKKAEEGSVMSRPPFGYKIVSNKLVPAENFREVEEIFQEFLTTSLSLRKISEKHNLSVNGLKKILKNFTYIGKIKFDNQIHQGNHEPIVSSTLFNHVQNKLERLNIK